MTLLDDYKISANYHKINKKHNYWINEIIQQFLKVRILCKLIYIKADKKYKKWVIWWFSVEKKVRIREYLSSLTDSMEEWSPCLPPDGLVPATWNSRQRFGCPYFGYYVVRLPDPYRSSNLTESNLTLIEK